MPNEDTEEAFQWGMQGMDIQAESRVFSSRAKGWKKIFGPLLLTEIDRTCVFGQEKFSLDAAQRKITMVRKRWEITDGADGGSTSCGMLAQHKHS